MGHEGSAGGGRRGGGFARLRPGAFLRPDSCAGQPMYEWWFVQSLRRSFRRKAALWPGKFDPALLKHVHSVRDFDEHITARYMGFAGAADYYDKASSMHVLDRIAIPTLVIHADDDPFIVMSEESRRKLEAQPEGDVSAYPKHGGHCAFIGEPGQRTAATMGTGPSARS